MVVLREAAGSKLAGTVAHANFWSITSSQFEIEVIEYKGSLTTVVDTDVTVYYMAK
jgi:hypothetical protein